MLLKVDQRTNYPQMTDVEHNASSDENENEVPSETSESNRLWTAKPTTMSSIRQLLTFKMRKNPKNKPSPNPMSNLLRKLTCGSNPDASAKMAACQQTPGNKPMAYRRCLRIRPSHAKNLSATHPPLGQVFAPELLQRNSSPTSSLSEDGANALENCWNENGAQPVLPSGGSDTEAQSQSSSFWALRLYNSFRRPRKDRNIRSQDKPDINPDLISCSKVKNSSSSVQLLELPARHQPLLHRYGVSQFVLLVDWNDAECRNSNFSATSSNKPRSVMRKPQQQHPRNKKCVSFQDSASLNSNSSTSV